MKAVELRDFAAHRTDLERATSEGKSLFLHVLLFKRCTTV